MARSKRNKRQTEVEKIKSEISTMASWAEVDNFDYSRYDVNANDIKLIHEWIENMKEERKKALPDELRRNDDILRRNREEYEMQVQAGLGKKNIRINRMRYDTILNDLRMEVKELSIMLEKGFAPVSQVRYMYEDSKGFAPVSQVRYMYEDSKEWEGIQREKAENRKLNLEAEIAEIEKHVKIVITEIAEQEEMIRSRRPHIIEEMKELGLDTSEFEEED